MRLTRWDTIPEAELLARLKTVRLMGHGQPEIYADADLSLVRGVPTDQLVPAQRYVLDADLASVFAIVDGLGAAGLDAFDLPGAIQFWRETPDGEEGPIPFLPPIVEESVEADGRTLWLINDGMHRCSAARSRNQPITIVLARNVPRSWPYYALPNPQGWDDVARLAALPDGFVKKAYRDPENYRDLFRDFNAVFDGVQKRRRPAA